MINKHHSMAVTWKEWKDKTYDSPTRNEHKRSQTDKPTMSSVRQIKTGSRMLQRRGALWHPQCLIMQSGKKKRKKSLTVHTACLLCTKMLWFSIRDFIRKHHFQFKCIKHFYFLKIPFTLFTLFWSFKCYVIIQTCLCLTARNIRYWFML